MKAFLLALLIFAPMLMRAQSVVLPIDSTTHKVTFTGVVQVPGVTQADLYSRAREWFATNFNSGKAVLDMDDKEAGKMIGKAYADFSLRAPLVGDITQKLWRQVKVYVKDGRYRYELTEFSTEGYLASGGRKPESYPVEWFLDKTKGARKGMSESVLNATHNQALAQIASLQSAMTSTAAAKKEKDW